MNYLVGLCVLGLMGACSQSSTLLSRGVEAGVDGGSDAGLDSGVDGGPGSLLPTLTNFRVENGTPERLHFDSSEPILASTVDGFIVAEKSIVSVTIAAGSTTGHYFTVSIPFSFWSNTTIRYEGAASDLRDLDGNPLHDFYLQYVDNLIAEPTPTGTEYYVSLSGDDMADGLSELNAWRTLGYALSNATPVGAGDVVYVEAGDYGEEQIFTRKNADTGDGESPIFVLGYQNTPGDTPDLGWSYPGNTTLDSTVMPLYRGNGTGVGFEVIGDNLIFRNLQVTNYTVLFRVTGAPERVLFDNVIAATSGSGAHSFEFNSDAGYRNRIINSVVYNGGTTLARFYGTYSLIENTVFIQDAPVGGGSYIETRGDGNIVRGSTLEHAVDAGSPGQGLNVKANGTSTEYCLFEDLEIVSIRVAIEASHHDTRFNVYRNIRVSRSAAVSQENVGGIFINNGASFNVFDSITVDDARTVLSFAAGTEDESATTAANNNLILNSVFTNSNRAISIGGGRTLDTFNNRIVGCNFYNIENMFFGLNETVRDNSFLGCQVVNASETDTPFGFSFEDSNFFGSWATPPGEGNIAQDPSFVNPAAHDFHLQASSPVEVRRGSRTLAVARYDADGNERSAEVSSIGAFEQD